MARYVLPTMFAAVSKFCLALMCLAIVDGVWIAAPVLAVPAIFLACAAAACRRSVPPRGHRYRFGEDGTDRRTRITPSP